MNTHNTISVTSKKILSAAALGSAYALNVADGWAATKSWTNGGGDNVWTTNANWSPAGAPGSGDLARIVSAGMPAPPHQSIWIIYLKAGRGR